MDELTNLSRRISVGYVRVSRAGASDEQIQEFARDIRIYGEFHEALGRMDLRRSVDYDRACQRIVRRLANVATSSRDLWLETFDEEAKLPQGYERVRPMAPLSGITEYRPDEARGDGEPKVYQCYPRKGASRATKRRR